MAKIIIRDETHLLLQMMSNTGMEDGRRLADGQWEIEITEETHERLQKHIFPGETFDELIERLCRLAMSGGTH